MNSLSDRFTKRQIINHDSQLNKLGLDVPMITQVMLELKKRGLDIPSDIFSTEEAVKVILDVIKRGVSND